MLKKLRLEGKTLYERTLATLRIAEMLDGFIDGREIPRCLGCEQGGIPHWDDFIVEHHDGMLEHMQIKRQVDDFSASPFLRVGDRGTPSTLDDAMLSLANWYHPQTGRNDVLKRSFFLEVLALNVRIKNVITLSHLEQLCTDCKVEGVTADRLEQRAVTDGPTQRLYDWLTTWCGFEGWEHVLAVLRRLTVRTAGNEADINTRAEFVIGRKYDSPALVRQQMLTYIDGLATDIGAITPLMMMRHLLQYALPGSVTWTQYRLDNAAGDWGISGTNGIADDAVESASAVVTALWKPLGADRKLRLAASCPQNDPNNPSITAAILRLALHLQGATQGIFFDEPLWRARGASELGHTLGLGDNDLENLPWVATAAALSPSETRTLEGIPAMRTEAQALSRAMDESVWEALTCKIPPRLESIGDTDLQTAMYALWATWRAELAGDQQARTELLIKDALPRRRRERPRPRTQGWTKNRGSSSRRARDHAPRCRFSRRSNVQLG